MTARCCITCQHGAMRHHRVGSDSDRNVRAMAKLGFVNCRESALSASFHPSDHSCDTWASAAPDVLAARLKWIETQAAAAATTGENRPCT